MKKLVKEFRKTLESQGRNIKIYEPSICEKNGRIFLMIRESGHKKLAIVGRKAPYEEIPYHAEEIGVLEFENSHYNYLICPKDRKNANLIQSQFAWLRPSPIGNKPAVGMGDRIEVCTPAQVKIAKKSKVNAVLAQQSIREMKHTEREPKNIIENAVWAVFQEGFKEKWTADADHLKNKRDIERCFKAGFSMYTLDPSKHIDEMSKEYGLEVLKEKFEDLPWKKLETSPEEYLKKYKGKVNFFKLTLDINKEKAMRTAVKYGHALAHIRDLSGFIEKLHGKSEYDLEVSVDEIEDPTTLIEHFIVASELQRLDIAVDSLAPRFPGKFEKGIDYIGKIEEFKEYFKKHILIAKIFGNKLSVHSGSDKFSIYPTLGEEERYIHLKTSGTSYLEALKVVSREDPEFFREIVRHARKYFEKDKKGYGNLVSAELSDTPKPEDLNNNELAQAYLEDEMGRQILHVTYGSILTAKDEEDDYVFKNKIHEILTENEDEYNKEIIAHFKDHLKPLGWIN